MNDRYGDHRNDRWRTRGQYRDQQREHWDRGQGRNHQDDDRGFLDRAGDEVRSWFGDDEAERRREADMRHHQMDHHRERHGHRHHHRDDDFWSAGYRGTGGGWGNQSADSWNRDRPGERDGDYDPSLMGGDYDRDDERSSRRRYARGTSDRDLPGAWGPSPFGAGDDSGRRFDRVDAGSTGTHGAHPYSSPTGGAYGGAVDAYGGISGRAAARRAYRRGGGRGGMGRGDMGRGDMGRERDAFDHDPHYSEWRSRQIEALDRDYDEYRREHQSKFESEFGNWRTRRTEQRQSIGRVTEQMEVVGSDGEHVGTVDKVRGDRIILTKNDEDAGGRHHSIPCGWIETVSERVTINKTAAEAKRAWRDEENNRALFERDDDDERGDNEDGPHVLNRSFPGTY